MNEIINNEDRLCDYCSRHSHDSYRTRIGSSCYCCLENRNKNGEGVGDGKLHGVSCAPPIFSQEVPVWRGGTRVCSSGICHPLKER